MKLLKSIGICAMLFAASISFGANWNTPYGSGDGDGGGYFSATGIPFTAIPNVQSNTSYVVLGGPTSLGAPLFEQIWLKPDLVAGTLSFYVPTNTWTIGSNSVAGTNQIWLTSTNLGLATNDICVIQHGSGAAQMVIVGGSASSSGLVATNAAGYNLVNLFNNITNAVTVGDKLYKMALRSPALTPVSMQNVTNDLPVQTGQWWMIATRAAPLKIYGTVGYPNLLALTYSNSAGLFTSGSFARRPPQ